MNRRFLTILAVAAMALPIAWAQSAVTLSGLIQSEEGVPDQTRVAVFQVDADGVWGAELSTVSPIAGTFSLTLNTPVTEGLLPFRSGAILLPALQNEYRIAPEGVNYALGRLNLYVDSDESGDFDRQADGLFLGLLSLEDPIGFFNIIYVDQVATLTASGANLEFQPGWNVFTVRFPGNDEAPLFEVVSVADDIILDVFLAE